MTFLASDAYCGDSLSLFVMWRRNVSLLVTLSFTSDELAIISMPVTSLGRGICLNSKVAIGWIMLTFVLLSLVGQIVHRVDCNYAKN